jgi:uncharacterized Ntn-hydrolase superfamily protein
MQRITIVLLALATSLATPITAQLTKNGDPLAHTYSIVARDSVSGEMGVAVQSHWFSVGTIVSWGEAGVGVVATQSFVNPSFGPRGLAMLKAGMTAQQAVDALIANDPGRDVRQLAILDAQGNAAAYTGKSCIPGAGHIEGDQYAVQANLMRNDKVWPAMSEAFETSDGPLADRMMRAMEAGEAAGGDIRGRQSIAILVVAAESTGEPWVDRKVDLRIDDHPRPLREMRRLLTVHKAYEHMNRGDVAIEHGDEEAALREYSAAQKLMPKNLEMQYWTAVSLVNIGRKEEAWPMFSSIFAENPDWKELTPRLVPGLLQVSEEELNELMR